MSIEPIQRTLPAMVNYHYTPAVAISAAEVYPKYLGVLESMLDYDYFNVICHLGLPKKYKKRPSLFVVQGISIGPGTCSAPPDTGI